MAKVPKVKNAKKSSSVSNPVESSNRGFIAFILVIVVLAVAIFGYIVVKGQASRADKLAERAVSISGVSMTFDKDNAEIKLVSSENSGQHRDVTIFEDFTCPHCGELAEATDGQMLEEIQNGNLDVTIAPMTFMDGAATGSSHEMLAAALAVADSGDVELWWNFRDGLFSNQFEYAAVPREKYAELASALGANDDTVQAIVDGDYIDMAGTFGDMNEEKMKDANGGEVGTPLLLLDGQVLQSGASTDWIDKVLAS